MEVINHFSHEEHPLILKELQEDDQGGLEKVDCYGCKQPISTKSKTYYYCCSECNVFLHKSCAELQREITHPVHPEHPFQLLAKPSYWSGTCECNICDNSWDAFTYQCSTCEFDVDVLCFQSLIGALKHPGHHHPLKHQPRKALFKCYGCGVKDEDESYYCPECSFWIHKTCGSMTSITSVKYHDHPLSLAYCLPEQYRHYYLDCDICNKKLLPSYWVYYCGPCRYFIHLKCMTSKSQEDEAAKPISNNDEEITTNLISLPADSLSELLIKHYREQNNIIPQAELSTEIQHFSHEHPLIISNVQEDYYEFTEDDQETVCSACVEPISGPCYTCPGCNYFIHLHCAHLPSDLFSSSVHPEHKLSICNHLEISDYSLCSKCDWYTNGFMYECKECDFVADVKCALLPATLKHEAHKHLLVQGEFSKELFCDGCSNKHDDIFFNCKTCPYKLALDCARLPKIVRHRWDRHPLILSFPPYYYHPDEFICDICGEECHPKYWIYHCRECNNSFHPCCIPRFDQWPNVSFGSKLRIDYHSHPLTFTRTVHYDKFSCDKCGKNLEGDIAFQCEPCYFNMCHPCVDEIVRSRQGQSTPEVE